jgi:hypothetical protein
MVANYFTKQIEIWLCMGMVMLVMTNAFADHLPTGIYKISSAVSSKVLDSTGADISTNGTRFQLWEYLGGLNQHFFIESSPDHDIYRIQLAASRKALDAAWPSMNQNGGAIILWDKNNNPRAAPTQQWRINRIAGSSNTFSIRLAANGKSLDAGAGTESLNGGIVQLWDFHGGRNQQWIIERVPGLRVIPEATWISSINGILRQTSVRLNNYTPNRHEFDSSLEHAYFRPNDSFFRTVIGGREFRMPITIPVVRRDPSSIYIVDMNTRRITTGFVGANSGYASGAIRVNLFFESEGKEFWTNCVNNAGCFAIMDRDIQMNNAVIQIDLEPNIHRGRFSYTNPDANLFSTVSISGCHDDLFAFLCDWFSPNAGSNLQRNVESRIETIFSSDFLKNTISTMIANRLEISLPLKSVRVYQNGDLEIVQN